MSTANAAPVALRPRRFWRLVGLALFGLVLALSFLAYFSPDMQLQWEAVAALCGF